MSYIIPTTETLGWIIAALMGLIWGASKIYPRINITAQAAKNTPVSEEMLNRVANLLESEGADYLLNRLSLPKDVIAEIKDVDFNSLAGFIADAMFLEDWISFDELAKILDVATTVKKKCESENNRDPTAAELSSIQNAIWKALDTKPLTTMAQIRAARTGSNT